MLICILSFFLCTGCRYYKDSSVRNIDMGDFFIGMEKWQVIRKFGAPFSFNIMVEGSDTLTTISYKTPKVVANCGYIVTTDLSFVNGKLVSVSQKDFFVPENVIVLDSLDIDANGGWRKPHICQ